MTTVAKSAGVSVTVTSIDGDWLWSADLTEAAYNKGLRLESMVFVAGDAGDKIHVKETNASGSDIFPPVEALGASYPILVPLNGKTVKPFIDYSECTLSAGHRFIMYFA